MSAGFPVDGAVLLAGMLLLVGVIAGDLASRLRIPSLLLFLGLGMAIADDGLSLVEFDNTQLAQNIATVALVVILFEGGLGTTPNSFRSAGLPAGLLATLGVLITAGVVSLAVWLIVDLEPLTAMLLGSVVASTDAAAVFAALRSEPLPERTRRVLQLESGLNDPLAVLLTVGLVETWRAEPSALDWTSFLFTQITGGAVVGLAIGVVGRRVVGAARGGAVASLGVLTLAIAAISYGLAAGIGGSGFLAVYVTGVSLANGRRSSRAVLYFHEGLASTAQAVLFLLLGILVFPSELMGELGTALIAAGALVFVARPLAVWALLIWTKRPAAEMAVISWAGLRGAVPVVLATIPTTAGHPDGQLVFNVAFVVVVVSVVLQAPTVGALARRLGVVAHHPPSVKPEIVAVDALGSDLVEMTVPVGSRLEGHLLADRPPPEGARIAVLRRDDTTLVPTGSSTLAADDTLLMVTSRECDLSSLEDWTSPQAESERP